MAPYKLLLLLLAMIGLSAFPAGGWCSDEPTQPGQENVAQAEQMRVAELIEQLGSTDFTIREKAQAELAKVGLRAFDALSDAQHHDDIEIALRARFLIRSLQVQWHDDGDSPDVISRLRGYGELSELERRSRIDALAALPNREGANALCRLARFEVSDELSKLAALHVLAQPPIEDAQARAQAAERVLSTVGSGKRTAAAWLRTYAKTLSDAESSLEDWTAHAKAEHELLTQFPERTSREIVRDLYRFQVTLLQRSNHPDRAVDVIRQSLSLMEGTPEQLAEIVRWLIHRQVSNVVEEIAGRFPQAFAESPELMYLRAESLVKQKLHDKAEELAAQALAIRPDQLNDHRTMAKELQKRGMFDWAQRELRFILNQKEAPAEYRYMASMALAEMFHDQAQEAQAAEVLQSFVDALDKDMAARDRLSDVGINSLRARMHYFYALHEFAQGKLEEGISHLDRGIEADPDDADVLIALYRLPNQDEARRKQTASYIRRATEKFREQINRFKIAHEQEPDEAHKATLAEGLAQGCNQLAWLVSNTTGDYDEALQCSLKSVELMPKYAAYLDTLGRCYFAKQDFENAIKHQKLALLEEPHSGQMQRQLDLFLKERDARKAAPQPDGQP